MPAEPNAEPPPNVQAPPGRGTRRTLGAWLRRVLVGLGHATDISVRPSPVTTDRNTQLAEQRTRLSFQRTFLSAERTLMSWIRTSLSMISFGFTMVKFFEYLAQERQKTLVGLFGAPVGPATLGLALISIGTVSLGSRLANIDGPSGHSIRADSSRGGAWRSPSRASCRYLGCSPSAV